jgi:hypothetical protein
MFETNSKKKYLTFSHKVNNSVNSFLFNLKYLLLNFILDIRLNKTRIIIMKSPLIFKSETIIRSVLHTGYVSKR